MRHREEKTRFPFIVAAAGGLVAARWAVRRRRRFEFRDASVVITGGSRGLGLELARRMAQEGARLTLLARDVGELERAQRELLSTGADVKICSCDVRDREDVNQAVGYVMKERGRLDVLINNAGVIQVGPAEHMGLGDFQDAMEVHVWGPLYLIHTALPHMRSQGGGRIVNISSIGGLVAVPHLLPYSMSKFALVGLSDGLRAELARENIRITTVAPGLMRTGSHVNAFFKGQHRKEYTWFAASAACPLFSTTSRQAARRIVVACRYGRARLIITPQARILHLANSLFPGLTAAGQSLAARLLPGPAESGGDQRHSGWKSRPAGPLSFFTRPADRAILRNNEQFEARP